MSGEFLPALRLPDAPVVRDSRRSDRQSGSVGSLRWCAFASRLASVASDETCSLNQSPAQSHQRDASYGQQLDPMRQTGRWIASVPETSLSSMLTSVSRCVRVVASSHLPPIQQDLLFYRLSPACHVHRRPIRYDKRFTSHTIQGTDQDRVLHFLRVARHRQFYGLSIIALASRTFFHRFSLSPSPTASIGRS